MNTVTYGRISTAEQNEDRQLKKGIKSFIDVCSGTIPFMERPKAKELIKYLKTLPLDRKS
jgi:DNA invertase Pin-like site-specific DNA recombinase